MKIDSQGVRFDDYKFASPNTHLSVFTDSDGGKLVIDTLTLIRMYELCKFDLQRSGQWDGVMLRLERS